MPQTIPNYLSVEKNQTTLNNINNNNLFLQNKEENLINLIENSTLIQNLITDNGTKSNFALNMPINKCNNLLIDTKKNELINQEKEIKIENLFNKTQSFNVSSEKRNSRSCFTQGLNIF